MPLERPVSLNAHKVLGWRFLVPDEEDGILDHLGEGEKRLVDPPDEAQETTHGARARGKIDLLGLGIVNRESLSQYVI